jgi:ribosomal protein S18 acetylase RimI-like enzyme
MSPESVLLTHADTERHSAFFRYVQRIFPGLDFDPWYLRGGWTPAYEVHAVADGGELLAAVAVTRTTAIVAGREHRGAQLGAVGVVPEVRGRGLMRPLLDRVLDQLEPEVDLFHLHANDTVLDFYPRFGFRRVEETDFELAVALAPGPIPAPRLDLDDSSGRIAWLETCARALPPTERFGMRDYGSVALWHASVLHPRAVRVLARGDAYAVAVQRGDTLHLLDLAAPRRFDLLSILPALLEAPIARVRFGFCPEGWCPAARPTGPHDDALFVRTALALPTEPVLLPALAQT